MFQLGIDWNPLQARCKEIILRKEHFDEAQELMLRLHSLVHIAKIYEREAGTFMDEVWENLTDRAFRTMPTLKDDTVAWNIWHITRIEDLTTNLLICHQDQVLNEDWLNKLNIRITDTGNAMTDDEINGLSSRISLEGLYDYRNSVGERTRIILESLKPEDMKRKVSREGLERIRNEGGVTEHPDSFWLLDFWGKKNIAGILQMPVTRHQVVHLNDCRRLKAKIK